MSLLKHNFIKEIIIALAITVPFFNNIHAQSWPKNTDTTTLKFTTVTAPEWTSLFVRNSGWFGADGIYSIPLNGNDKPGNHTKTLLIFSDTMIGDVVNDIPQPGYVLVHNTCAYVDGVPPNDHIHFIYAKDKNGKPKTMFSPNTPLAGPKDFYWLGDGFVNPANGKTYINAFKVKWLKDNDAFAFDEHGTSLIIIPKGSKPPFIDQQQKDTPFFIPGKTPDDYGVLGSAVFVNTKSAGAPNPDGYIYVYGTRPKHLSLLVARVLPQDYETFSKWRYWDGKTWTADINRIAEVTTRVSHELSVSPLPDGRYALVFQTDGLGNNVGLRLGLSPQGPFGPVINLYTAPENSENKNLVPYNAKAHTNLSNPNELLISYNVISLDFFNDIKRLGHHYHPRFIRVKLQQ
jgi:hypothetical protein